MSDEAATGHMAEAVQEIIKANGGGRGDYLIICEASSDEDGMLFTWRWAWSPRAPRHGGRAGT